MQTHKALASTQTHSKYSNWIDLLAHRIDLSTIRLYFIEGLIPSNHRTRKCHNQKYSLATSI